MIMENDVVSLFKEKFSESPEVVCHAPGRVNLIGDHTDYNDGFVLPAAINFSTAIAIAKRSDSTIRAFAQGHSDDVAEISLDNLTFNPDLMWTNYLAGTLKTLMTSYQDIKGADLVVMGDVPLGAGLSSSASFEIAILKAFAELYELDLDGIQAALLGQKAENEFVGCNCGIMDQLISSMGREGHAMLLDCRDLTFSDAPIPDDLSVVIINSNVKRELVDSEYNLRRSQCEQVAAHFGIQALRDLSIERLDSEKELLNDELYRRARHVITENNRTELMLEAMLNHDIDSMSTLMRDSHASMRDDYEITTKEIDGLVSMIDKHIGQSGGVRMTGGGFGGCVVSLVPKEMTDSLIYLVNEQYERMFNIVPEIFVCIATQGAFRTITKEG